MKTQMKLQGIAKAPLFKEQSGSSLVGFLVSLFIMVAATGYAMASMTQVKKTDHHLQKTTDASLLRMQVLAQLSCEDIQTSLPAGCTANSNGKLHYISVKKRSKLKNDLIALPTRTNFQRMGHYELRAMCASVNGNVKLKIEFRDVSAGQINTKWSDLNRGIPLPCKV